MLPKTTRKNLTLAVIAAAAVAVTGCNVTTRLSEVGDGPQLSKITNPTVMPDYRPVSLPMPAPKTAEHNPNSLWRAGAKAFFKDHRAKAVGDILTVQLNLDDSASLANSTERERDDSEDTDVTNLLGLEAEFAKKLPQAIAPGSVMSFGSKHETKGDGSIDRSETVELTFAAVVTQILPNGALAIIGRQEVQVNNELRELMVTGVIRPEDIESDNTITHDKIAEMRVAYGGRGTLSGLQNPRWGTEVWDILFPF
ncbi:MAG: flagellar basal body L-ring protein FlgH [Rhodospirillaceae bacterium]|jgi:flagellar L-ring protein precursor FlgH|nr:flagellar basal body L-ring protein FlgH [Rhodospirillales bacterium]MBT3906604.1 flagellar basal body L-ring protein FlgH [Rhodospirillaceae bacterium]MBT4703191.1 flagellar basal body L-ring protein FlgH [Rhodospirillaceae bacterium]MBT5033204.1 flagellar basal body L-ring protein FlgH [Rhodospirillaceae bacterium]MBT6219025.1 flagellar basal body L-ring protein FlgH [Rhodospirillaceae bacterium]